MADCEKLQTSPFFTDKMNNMPNTANLMKQIYCVGDKMQCARYQVNMAEIPVPPDIFPHDRDRVRKILKG